MSRNFGIMSGRSALGGMSDRPSAAPGSYAPSDSSISFDEPGLLFFAMVIAPLLFVGLIVLCHRALV